MDADPMLRVTLLGTGSPMPDPNRAGPATLVSAGGEHYLVDAGRGVLMRLAAADLGAPDLAAVLITHLHSDHITDLNDIVTTRWVMSMEPAPLTIVGPVGTKAVVAHIVASLAPDIGYRMVLMPILAIHRRSRWSRSKAARSGHSETSRSGVARRTTSPFSPVSATALTTQAPRWWWQATPCRVPDWTASAREPTPWSTPSSARTS